MKNIMIWILGNKWVDNEQLLKFLFDWVDDQERNTTTAKLGATWTCPSRTSCKWWAEPDALSSTTTEWPASSFTTSRKISTRNSSTNPSRSNPVCWTYSPIISTLRYINYTCWTLSDNMCNITYQLSNININNQFISSSPGHVLIL